MDAARNTQDAWASRLTRLRDGQAPLLFAIVVTALMGAAIFALAVVRAPVEASFNYNEGWNAFFQTAPREGRPLYPAPDALVFNNYPPLSFLIVAGLAGASGDVIVIARIISLISILVIALSAGVIARNLTRGERASAFAPAALCLLAMSALPTSVYVGVDDPQMLAQALMAMALAVYTLKPEARGHLALTVALLVLGGMVKHNLLAEPIAIGLDVLSRSRGRALLFGALSALALALAAIFMQFVSHGRIWQALLSPRTYDVARGLHLTVWSLGPTAAMLCLSGLALLGQLSAPGPRFIALYFVSAMAVGLVFSGGAGVSINLFFSVFIAMAIAVGMLINEIAKGGVAVVGVPAPAAAGLLLLTAATSIIGGSLPRLEQFTASQQEREASAQAVAYLAAREGEAICSSPYLCLRAGKGMIYDPFNAGEAAYLRPETAARVRALMNSGRVETVALTPTDAALVLAQAPLDGPGAVLLEQVRSNYEMLWRAPDGVVFFAPREPAR